MVFCRNFIFYTGQYTEFAFYSYVELMSIINYMIQMKKLKKRFIVPAVVFILGMCALIGAIYVVGESQKQQNRTNAKLNAKPPLRPSFTDILVLLVTIPCFI